LLGRKKRKKHPYFGPLTNFTNNKILTIKYFQAVTASIKDTTVDGVEGFNINWEAPFKFDDYVVGFRYALGNFRKAPESLFAKKSFETPGDAEATVDVDYNVDSKVVSATAKWATKDSKYDLELEGNSDDIVTLVTATTKQDVDDYKVKLSAGYDLLKKKIFGKSEITLDDTTIGLSGDNVDKDAILKVSHKLDSKNTLEPTLSLKTGDITYGFIRELEGGGSVEGTLFPGEKFDVKWKDNGANGVWTTKASIPVKETENTKITFSRDWKY
jgi:hypothetical protein